MKRKALLIGINYLNTQQQLNGCINDVNAMADILINQYHFKSENVIKLLENDATTDNIRSELHNLVNNVEPGDIVFFHYSGHGSQIYNRSSDDVEVDGLDEILCPIDLDWKTKLITDDELKAIFNLIPNGAFFTAILDCCHSGGAIDHDNQYQPVLNREILTETPDASNAGRFMIQPQEILNEIAQYRQSKTAEYQARPRNINKTGVMISGCRSDQTSADAFIGGKYMGACTFHLIDVLRTNHFNITNKSLVDDLNRELAAKRFTQRPELNGDHSMHDQMFLQLPAVILPEDRGLKPQSALSSIISKIVKFFKN